MASIVATACNLQDKGGRRLSQVVAMDGEEMIHGRSQMTVGTSETSILVLCIDCLGLFHVASLSRSMHPT